MEQAGAELGQALIKLLVRVEAYVASRYKVLTLGTLGAGCRCKFSLKFFFYPSKAWIL